MTYAAIVERYGIARFCADAAAAGATGLIVADVPPDDGDELRAPRARATASTSCSSWRSRARDARLALACRASRGFVYVVSAIGTTGAREELDVERLRGLLARVRAHARRAAVAVRLRRLAARPRARPARRRAPTA